MDTNISYAIGVFPTLELLTHQANHVSRVILSTKSSNNAGVDKIRQICQQKDIQVEESDKFINKLSSKENCHAVGVFRKYESNIRPGENHLVLVGIRDMGNLGTICRTMIGFNFSNLAIIKPAADILDSKVIRSSMGAVFQLNFRYFESFADYQKLFTNNLYSFMTNGRQDLAKTDFIKPYSLIFGSEASGLDESFRHLGTSVKIAGSKNIDSLNLSVAVGITLYSCDATRI